MIHALLYLPCAHAHRCCLYFKKALLLSFPESLVVSPSMPAGCREKGEELKCQRSPDKKCLIFRFLSARLYHLPPLLAPLFLLNIHSFFSFMRLGWRDGVLPSCVYVRFNTLLPVSGVINVDSLGLKCFPRFPIKKARISHLIRS